MLKPVEGFIIEQLIAIEDQDPIAGGIFERNISSDGKVTRPRMFINLCTRIPCEFIRIIGRPCIHNDTLATTFAALCTQSAIMTRSLRSCKVKSWCSLSTPYRPSSSVEFYGLGHTPSKKPL